MATQNTENTIDGNLITNVLTHFNKYGDLAGDVVCKVECTICTTELAILQPPDEDHNTWTVMESCGHMFCYECIVAWIDSKSRPDCPVCRTSLSHLYCLHKYKPQEITLINGFNIHEDVPKVVGELPHRCPDCMSGVATRRISLSSASDDGVDDAYAPFVATGRMSLSSISDDGVGDVYNFSVSTFGSPLGSDSDSDLGDLSDSDSRGHSDDGSELDFGFDRDVSSPLAVSSLINFWERQSSE
ncbi:hypothetical protein LQW54_010927 [Pestalotiopsis sp. IQ-011]